VKDFIFGYGSLVSPRNLARFLAKRNLKPREVQQGRISGFRRVWNVAMDNTRDLPGYKFYRDAVTGERPECYVTFLNIEPCGPEDSVNGVAFEIPHEVLSHFDRRERNYERIDVTQAFVPAVDGRVWAYMASDDGLERYRRGLAAGRAVVDTQYYKEVDQAFRDLGSEAYERYVASTLPPEVQQRDLVRYDIPESAPQNASPAKDKS